MIKKISIVFTTLVLTVIASCTIDEQHDDSIVNPTKGPVSAENAIQVAQRPPTTIVFDRLRRIYDLRCPNAGPNCAVYCPKPPRAVLDEVDFSISNGPAGVGAFFSNTDTPWQYIAENIDTAYPALFAKLAAGEMWMFRGDHPDDSSISVFSIGDTSTTPSVANASYRFMVEKP